MATVLDHATLRAIAERALDEWDICAAQLELISISENTVFRVDTDSDETYVLRIHRPGYHSLSELNSEQQWTAALKQVGIGVPLPRLTCEGYGYATVPVPGSMEIRHVGLVEWFKGITLSSIMAQAPDMQTLALHFDQLGRIATRIHNQAVNWQIPEDFQRHAFDAEGLMGDTPFWGPFWVLPELKTTERDYILNARRTIYQALTDYGKEGGTYSLIHADLHPHNLLVNGDQLHVIDFDDAGFGWHQYEIAIALDTYRKPTYFEVARDALIAGYRSERPLSDTAIKLLPMFLLIRSLALLGWLHERREHNRGDRVRNLIQSACRQAEALGM